jgi:outer membrane lipoprotein-sorting protein
MRNISMMCVLIICTVVLPAKAQGDAKAKVVLDNMTKKVKSLKTLKANFELKITGGKVKDTKKGNISVKGEKYHVELGGQEIICDNKTIWTYNKDAKEVQVNSFNASEQSMSPAKLLTNSYEKDYKYTYKGEKKEKGKTLDLIELTPNDNNSKASKVELMVDKATSMVSSGTIWEKNGNKIEYSISEFKPDANIPDTYFAWDSKAHAGVEVVDLR